MSEHERPPFRFPVVKQLWEIYVQMRGVTGWSWVLHPWMIQHVMVALAPDGGAALTIDAESVRLFGRFVRYDTNVTTVMVEWH